MPLADMFRGDRYGQVADPFGHIWAIATHLEDLGPAALDARSEAFMAEMARMAPPPAPRPKAPKKTARGAAKRTAKRARKAAAPARRKTARSKARRR
jgi:hypothetical protein